MDKQICIGTIVAPHGVRGDIRILPQTEHPEQFLDLDYLLLEDGRTLHLTNARFHKRMALVKCREVNNMNEAELLRGKKVFIHTEDLPELGEGEFYVADLLGCNVVDAEGAQVGVLKDVISTGSNDVYIVKAGDGKEILVPALKQHVKEINPQERRIVVKLPEWVDEK
ncbi:MAG: 16S rRNA processing protein RimM [Phascolarctobacterium sp.]|nr:MAG: 16S rRNA processing protein RimM [Phascolarctobacterium sp.]